jgi:monoamine oxidase
VIGAGVAGIATSKTLSDHGHEHLILEGRRRIGGRIEAGDLSGTKVDLGATFVHNPSQKNMIYELIQNISWPTVPAHMSYIEELYKPGVTQDSTIKREASAFINRFHTWIPSYLKGLDHDIGLSSSWALFEKAQNQKLHSKALYQSYF